VTIFQIVFSYRSDLLNLVIKILQDKDICPHKIQH